MTHASGRTPKGFFNAVPVIAGTAFFIILFSGCPEKTGKLQIRDTVSGRIYGQWVPGESMEFAIEFIHSVNMSPVRETYRIEDGKLRPVSVRFHSFGAGMLSDLDEGRILTRDGDAMIISGFGASYSKLGYIVGTVSDHVLFINDEVISLRDLCGRNAHITIQYKR